MKMIQEIEENSKDEVVLNFSDGRSGSESSEESDLVDLDNSERKKKLITKGKMVIVEEEKSKEKKVKTTNPILLIRKTNIENVQTAMNKIIMKTNSVVVTDKKMKKQAITERGKVKKQPSVVENKVKNQKRTRR